MPSFGVRVRSPARPTPTWAPLVGSLALERERHVGLHDGREVEGPDPAAVAAEGDDLSVVRVKRRLFGSCTDLS